MKKLCSLFLILFVFFSSVSVSAQVPLSAGSEADMRKGYEAFRNEDWVTASLFLRKVVASSGNASDESHFMLIKSEIFSGEYQLAQQDCEIFLSKFPLSVYSNYVQYQNGRMLHLLGRNEDAILVLSDFCHQHYDDELYPLALYWIAEAFYDEYNFESAKGLYQRLVSDFAGSEKVMDAQYKLDLIEQRAREEKLLYLLKVIGEENLSTREEYERQIRIYEMEDRLGLNREVLELQTRIEELENQLAMEGGSAIPPDDIEFNAAPARPQPSGGQRPSGNSYGGSPNYGGSGAGQGGGQGGQGGQSGSGGQEGDSSGQGGESGAGGSPSPVKKAATVQVVNEPSLHLKKKNNTAVGSSTQNTKTVNRDVEALKRKAKQLQYLLEDQSAEGAK